MTLVARASLTVTAALRDRGLAILFVAAIPVYRSSIRCPMPTQSVRDVPLVVVDRDGSAMSRDIVSRLARSRQSATEARPRPSARRATRWPPGASPASSWCRENFSRDAMRGMPTAVTVFGSGAYPVQDKAVLGSVGAVVQDVAGEVSGARLVRQGAPAAAVLQAAARAGPAFVDQPLFNLARGYGSYVVAAVGILIVQQVMLMAIAALVGTWLEGRNGTLFAARAPGPGACSARSRGFALFVFVALLYFIGFVFWFHDYPRGGNLAGAVAFAALMALTVACLGVALGAWFADRERALLRCCSPPRCRSSSCVASCFPA